MGFSQISVPGVQVNIIPPNPLIQGVPTGIIGDVGTASWGPINSQVVIGSLQQQVQNFGPPIARKYDLGSSVYAAMQQGANSFVCVRVTDGTDVAATASLLDIDMPSGHVGLILSSKYTGSLPNNGNLTATISAGSGSTPGAALYRLTVAFANGVPEIFDGIGGASGSEIWSNIANAVNNGQGNFRGPSQIVTAATQNVVSSVAITAAGSYATLPTFGTSGPGSGAVFVGTMKTVSATVAAAGTGYVVNNTITLAGGTFGTAAIVTVNTIKLVSVALNAAGTGYSIGDTITLAGGTSSVAAILNVETITTGGVIATVSIISGGTYTVGSTTFTQTSTSGTGTGATFNTGVFGVNTVTPTTLGSYTVLPSSPVSQSATSGSGTGATLTVLWGVLSVAVTSEGSGYDTTTQFIVTGGGGAGGALGTLGLGGANLPALASYSFGGGSDGATGVNSASLVGVDASTTIGGVTYSRTGMYVLRNSQASVVILSDADDPAQWTNQVTFGQQESTFVVGTCRAGLQDDISTAVGLKQTAGINSYNFKLMTGDWCLINDPFNNVTRYISPQGFTAGEIAVQLPSGSALNKVLNAIVSTQKTAEQRIYTNADLLQLEIGGLDVITNPIPAGKAFGVRIGINTSNNSIQRFDNYTRMVNFLANSFKFSLGQFIGLPQTDDFRRDARNSIQSFLQGLKDQNMIGNVNGGPAFSVVLDASNNPLDQVALGYMQANVQVTLLSIIQNFVINLQAGQNIQVQVLPPQFAQAA